MELIRLPLAGVSLAAEIGGDPHQPSVIFLHGDGQTRHEWAHAARSLVHRGYHVISLDLRGHGDSGAPRDNDFSLDAYVADLRAVIATLPQQPTLVASGLGALIALTAVGESNHHDAPLASRLIIVDGQESSRAERYRQLENIQRALAIGCTGLDTLAEVLASARLRIDGCRISTLRKYVRADSHGVLSWHQSVHCLHGAPWITDSQQRLRHAAARISIPTLYIRGNQAHPEMAGLVRSIGTLIRAEVGTTRPLLSCPNEADPFDQLIREHFKPACGAALGAIGSARSLRRVFGAFATGVTVVTTVDRSGRPIGLTANSFTSVSLNPPLILFCLDKGSSNLSAFEEGSAFAVNILDAEQQALSARFVSKQEDRFASVPWETWDLQVPILQGVAANLECERHAVIDAGDHRIFIGRVRHTWFDPQRAPLLYFQGGYRQVHGPGGA